MRAIEAIHESGADEPAGRPRAAGRRQGDTMRRHISIGTLVILVVVSACGGDQSNPEQGAAAAGEDMTACDLLTLGDLQDVTGQPFEMGTSHTEYDCGYVSVATNANGVAKNSVYLRITEPRYSVGPDDALDGYVTTMKEGLGDDAAGYDYTEAPGIGALAIWDRPPFSESSVQLVVFDAVSAGGKSGTVMMTVQLVDFERESGRQYAQALAARALPRLGPDASP